MSSAKWRLFCLGRNVLTLSQTFQDNKDPLIAIDWSESVDA